MSSLLRYDSAMTSKKYRPIFLEILKSLKWRIVNKWTHLRGIQHITENCRFQNLKYVSDICTNLTVFGVKRRTEVNFVNIENDHIVNLRVDIFGKNELNNLRCHNLKNLIIVNIYRINNNIFENLKNTCPNINKIIIITRDRAYTEDMINNIINDKNVKVKIKHMQ